MPDLAVVDDLSIVSAPLLKDLDEVLCLTSECIAIALAPAERNGNADLVRVLLTYRTATARCRADMRKAIS
jgi:hypothetical protein